MTTPRTRRALTALLAAAACLENLFIFPSPGGPQRASQGKLTSLRGRSSRRPRRALTALLAAAACLALTAVAFASDGEAPLSNMYATFWGLVPPIVAIVLALITTFCQGGTDGGRASIITCMFQAKPAWLWPIIVRFPHLSRKFLTFCRSWSKFVHISKSRRAPKASPYFLEAVPPGMNKGAAVIELCRHLGIDAADTAAAGDEGNDVSMIRAAGLGVAMANAVPAAREAAATDFTDAIMTERTHGTPS